MSRSLISRLAGLSAAAVIIAGAINTSTAGAFLLPGPCTRTGPGIVQSGASVLGSCFTPGAEVQVEFSNNAGGRPAWNPVESVHASATGTISVPMLYTPEPTWQTEYIIADEGNPYVHLTLSNVIVITPQVAQ